MGNRPTVADIIVTERAEILKAWLSHLKTSLGDARLGDEELKQQADELLAAITDSLRSGTDIAGKGWQMLVGFSEIHHSRSNEDTAERVRGGQEGRVLDGDGSAGDFPYGYRSEYVDPQAALGYHGRGPKPRKRVVIDEASTAVVRRIFERFAGGESISSITRWLTSEQHEIPRIGKGDWHHEHVRRILTNPKYIGTWPFGKTTTVRDGSGKKKQVAARKDQKVTVVPRPQLRIIDQPTWDAAQAKLAELMKAS